LPQPVAEDKKLVKLSPIWESIYMFFLTAKDK
jgi:hypothetical protein